MEQQQQQDTHFGNDPLWKGDPSAQTPSKGDTGMLQPLQIWKADNDGAEQNADPNEDMEKCTDELLLTDDKGNSMKKENRLSRQHFGYFSPADIFILLKREANLKIF